MSEVITESGPEFESVFESLFEAEAEAEAAAAAPVPQTFQELRGRYYEALYAEAERLRNDNNIDLRDADIRFSTTFNLARARRMSVCVIGAGGLGNWQWRILVSMGFQRVIIYDDDVVGIENVGSQCHSVFDIGMPKVDAARNAALEYRGLSVLARNRRVYTVQDIIDDLGFCPDIVIGCTDSAEFRNGFIENLASRNFIRQPVPELFMDYRMSLGDWVAYCVPVSDLSDDYVKEKYMKEAVFPESEAMREPCTARAISYTGANLASFTGAYLHWYLGEGYELMHSRDFSDREGYYEPNYAYMKFHWKTSFSARDFEPITGTLRERKLDAKLKRANNSIKVIYNALLRGRGNMDFTVYANTAVDFITYSMDLFKANTGYFLYFPTKEDDNLYLAAPEIDGGGVTLFPIQSYFQTEIITGVSGAITLRNQDDVRRFADKVDYRMCLVCAPLYEYCRFRDLFSNRPGTIFKYVSDGVIAYSRLLVKTLVDRRRVYILQFMSNLMTESMAFILEPDSVLSKRFIPIICESFEIVDEQDAVPIRKAFDESLEADLRKDYGESALIQEEEKPVVPIESETVSVFDLKPGDVFTCHIADCPLRVVNIINDRLLVNEPGAGAESAYYLPRTVTRVNRAGASYVS